MKGAAVEALRCSIWEIIVLIWPGKNCQGIVQEFYLSESVLTITIVVGRWGIPDTPAPAGTARKDKVYEVGVSL